MTASERIRAARAKAETLTAAQTTAQIVQAFRLSGELSLAGLSPNDCLTVYTARGFMIEELERRGELHLIGV